MRMADSKRQEGHTPLSRVIASDIARAICIAFLYFVLARLSLIFVVSPEGLTVIWPPSGFILAVLLLTRRGSWPITMLCVFLANVLANLSGGNSVSVSLGFAFANALEPLVSAFLLTRFVETDLKFNRVRDVAGFVLVAVVVGNALTAIVGAAVPALGFGAPYWNVWLIWWIADGVGMLLITPLIMTWTADTDILREVSLARAAEAFVLIILFSAVSAISFGAQEWGGSFLFSEYVIFPFLIWSALRFGPRETTAVVFILAVISVPFTIGGAGHFVEFTHSFKERVLAVQMYLGISGFTTLLLAAFVSEHKLLKEALMKARELDQILVDALPYPSMLIQYPERIILNANRPAKEAGAIIGGICHRDFGKDINAVPGTNQCSFCRADEMYEEGETIITKELFAYDMWWSVYWIPVKKNIYLHFGIDISESKKAEDERKKLEEQLRQSQKMEAIGVLAGGVAHDFNNILMAIIGYGSMAQNRLKDDPTLQEYLKEMLAGADRAAELTRGLLAFSRKQVINPRPQDLNRIVTNMEKMLRRIIGEDIEFKTVLSNRAIKVMVDTSQMDQVLLNLTTNARDAMPEGGRLIIGTDVVNVDDSYAEAHLFEKTGKYAVLTVSDTGIGMDLKTRNNIFEPFFTTKEVGKGTGLGLAMVYGIIKQHGGNINVYSELGKGTTFSIYLPVVRTEDDKADKIVLPALNGKGETILIAEDDEQVRKIIRIYLSERGYEVVEAVNGEDAVGKFRENADKVSAIILDVIMPVKNGRAVYDEIKRLKPDIKAIFMSGYTDDIMAKKGILEEGFEFISKPINPEDMLRKIRDVLDKK